MARTSRGGAPAASMDALDNIDLDDMFADDGDDLFDGLDIDLDMDDITGGGGGRGLDASGSGHGQSGRPSARANAPLPLLPPPPSLRDDDESVGNNYSRTRRKTKRKAKTPAFFEDNDEDFYDEAPVKKKRKATKATAASRKKAASKIVTQDDAAATSKVPPSATIKGHNNHKGRTATTTKSGAGMPPPLPMARGQSTPGSYVAAAGQFGGRQPRGSSFTLPKASSGGSGKASNNHHKLPMGRAASDAHSTFSNKSRAPSLPPTSAAAAAASVAAAQRGEPLSAPQRKYCGLPPSRTLFYPFMPALPSEPAMKRRKDYSSIDRIHSSFTTHLQSSVTSATADVTPAKDSEPICLLMQEAFKEDYKPPPPPPLLLSSSSSTVPQQSAAGRAEAVGNAIGALRQTISLFDTSGMVGDWYAACGLLQRQHDFLKQNGENMERWCRDHFSGDDFASVFLPSSKKRRGIDGSMVPTVLGSFTTREIKVKILCHGYKEPRTSGPLRATLPQRGEAVDGAEKSTKPTAKTKKQKPSAAAVAPEFKLAELVHLAKAMQPPQPLSYLNMNPARRRRNVGEMLTRTARELENSHHSKSEARRRVIDRQETELQKLVDQDNITGIHTAGMWKWLETSGYFSNAPDAEIQQLLEDIQSQEAAMVAADVEKLRSSDLTSAALIVQGAGASDNAADESLFDRMQSLLVDENASGDDEGEDEHDLADVSFEELYTVTETADLSRLSIDERAYIHLGGFGLAEKFTFTQETAVAGSDTMAATPCTTEVGASFVEATSDDAVRCQNGHTNQPTSFEEVEIGDHEALINAMKTELLQVCDLNNRRAAFLGSASRSCRQSAEDEKLKSEREATLIARCQQLLRKSSEHKAKSGAMNKKDDSLALPW